MEKDTTMRYSNPDDNHSDTPRVVQSNVVALPNEVNVIANGTRAGNADRDRTVNHIVQMADHGYITQEEAERRIRAVDDVERQADLRHLTSDLPAPIVHPSLIGRYDWDEPKCWIPTLITGMAVSGMTAILPASILSVEHLFPQSGVGLAVGIVTLIVGVLAFFGCLAGIIVKANDD